MHSYSGQSKTLASLCAACASLVCAGLHAPVNAQSTSDPEFEIGLRGRLQTDLGIVGDPERTGTFGDAGFAPDRGLGAAGEVRRARIGVEGRYGDWAFEAEADFADGDVEANDFWVGYRPKDSGLDILIGHQKTPVSMEETTSTLTTRFIERAGFTDAFGFGRETGVSVAWRGDNWAVIGGAYIDGAFSGDDTSNGYLLTARAHYAWQWDDGLLHLGASTQFHDNGAEVGRLRQRPMVHTTDTRFIEADLRDLSPDGQTFAGAEFAIAQGPFDFTAEYGAMLTDTDAGTHMAEGAAIGGGWFLTGEQRKYLGKDGMWGMTAPDQPLGAGGFGALQVNAGVDWLEMNDDGTGIRGGRQVAWQAGLIWIPVTEVRFLATVNHLEIDDSPTRLKRRADGGFTADFHLTSVGLRAQVHW